MFLKRSGKSRLYTLVLIWLGGFVFAAALSLPEAAAKSQNQPGKIVYDPSSGSYFEFIRYELHSSSSTWGRVRATVNKRTYKGIRGRLAVIKTRATHEFLRKNLGITMDAWIGLRYHCASGKLVWVTGEILRRGVDFEIWHSRWHYESRNVCGDFDGTENIKYLPVFYANLNGRLYWRASGPGHYMTGAIFEYPTR